MKHAITIVKNSTAFMDMTLDTDSTEKAMRALEVVRAGYPRSEGYVVTLEMVEEKRSRVMFMVGEDDFREKRA